MQVQLKNPALQAKIEQWVSDTGRPAEELVEDIVAGYFDEAARVRETLDSRYDEVKSGRVVLLDGEEFFEDLRKREEELLKQPVGQ